jgi:hypothetical protein
MYLLDADVMITAKNRYYGFDIVPTFWEWLASQHTKGRLFIPQKIADEVLGAGDDLSDWVRQQPPSFRLQVESNDQQHLQTVASWAAADSSTYAAAAVATFLNAGDYYLVSLGLSRGFTVVTNELPDPNSKKRIKIPDACRALGVPCMSPFAMLRAEGFKL